MYRYFRQCPSCNHRTQVRQSASGFADCGNCGDTFISPTEIERVKLTSADITLAFLLECQINHVIDHDFEAESVIFLRLDLQKVVEQAKFLLDHGIEIGFRLKAVCVRVNDWPKALDAFNTSSEWKELYKDEIKELEERRESERMTLKSMDINAINDRLCRYADDQDNIF